METMDFGTPVDENWDNALFLLKVTCDHSLTHEGVTKLSQSVQDFTEDVCAKAANRCGVVHMHSW